MTLRRFSLAAGLGVALVVAACNDEQLFPPAVPQYTGGAMFQRYVSIGNSLTAGFQSGGINDSTQMRAYPVLVAAAMGGDRFYWPVLNYAPAAGVYGCPPPIDTLFTATGVPHRMGGGSATTCGLRSLPAPPYISNVAVPGAAVVDPFHTGPTATSNALTLLILGGRSQVQAMQAVRPTFVSVWIGNNDVLGAATNDVNAGNPDSVTPVALFQARYDSMLAAIDATPSIRGGILIGVGDVAVIPYFSYGQIYFGAKLAGQLPAQMTVLANCAPTSSGGIGDTVLVPFPYGFAKIDSSLAGAPTTLDCSDDHNIEPAELANLHATVAAYNTFISARATARGWAYLDPNVALAALRADTSQVKPFPNTTATSCNGSASGNPFGKAFSCDGIHPSTATHHLIAQTLVQVINAKYSSAIPAVP
jgi:hypothetical protein